MRRFVATAASASSLADESRLRQPKRRRCVLTPADVVRDELTILEKKIEEIVETVRPTGSVRANAHSHAAKASQLLSSVVINPSEISGSSVDSRSTSSKPNIRRWESGVSLIAHAERVARSRVEDAKGKPGRGSA